MKFFTFFLPSAFCGLLPFFEELTFKQFTHEELDQPIKLTLEPMVATGKMITFLQENNNHTVMEISQMDVAFDPMTGLGRQSISPIFKSESGIPTIQEVSQFAQVNQLQGPVSSNTSMFIGTKESDYQFTGNGQGFSGYRYPAHPGSLKVYATFENVTFIGTKACKLYRVVENTGPHFFSQLSQGSVSEAFYAFDVFTNELVMAYSIQQSPNFNFVFVQLVENVKTVSKQEIEEKYAKVPKILEAIATDRH